MKKKNEKKRKRYVCAGEAARGAGGEGGAGRGAGGTGWGGGSTSHFLTLNYHTCVSLSSLHVSYPAVLLTTEQLQRNVLTHTTTHKQQLNTSAFEKQSSSSARR